MPPAPTPSKLDQQQILQGAYDEASGELRVQANVTANISGTQEVLISHTDDSIQLGDGTNLVTATPVGSDVGLDVNIVGGVVSGSFTQSGLSIGIKTTRFTVTDTPQPIPATAFANRNTLSVRVLGASTVYFGGNALTATNGYPKFQFEEISMDVTDDAGVNLYAVCDTGESSEIAILEIA